VRIVFSACNLKMSMASDLFHIRCVDGNGSGPRTGCVWKLYERALEVEAQQYGAAGKYDTNGFSEVRET
jgi:hypothetical protein